MFYTISLAVISYSAIPLSLKTLTRLEWKDGQGRVKTFSLVYKVSSKWQEFCTRLGQDPKHLTKKHRGNGIKIWKEVMDEWLSDGGTQDYPATWEGLCLLLDNMNLSSVTTELRHAVNKCGAAQ